MIFTPRRAKTVGGENQLLFFSFSPLWRCVGTVAKSMRKREDMLITVEQPRSPRREGAGEAGSGHGGGKLNGPDGQVTLWTKSPPLPLLGHRSDLQTNTQGTNLFPLISCSAQQLQPRISDFCFRILPFSNSCLFV